MLGPDYALPPTYEEPSRSNCLGISTESSNVILVSESVKAFHVNPGLMAFHVRWVHETSWQNTHTPIVIARYIVLHCSGVNESEKDS